MASPEQHDAAPSQAGEDARLDALSAYDILDTPAEVEFDDIVHLACQLCDTSTALVCLVAGDRQWFKARIGFETSQTSLDHSVCMHAVGRQDLLVIPDLSLDERTRNGRFVIGEPFLRFYAGAPLVTPEGYTLGTLCVLDGKPRLEGLSERQAESLQRLARQVMKQLELRRVIAERDAVARRVQEADTRHRQILDSAVDYGIITMKLNGDVTSWNTGAERILGWSEREMCGRPADVFFTPEDVAAGVPESEMRSARERGRGMDERWHMRKDGSRFFAMGEMMPLTSGAGEHVGYLKILRDQTRQREIDERLEAADERLQIGLAASGVIGLWDWMVDTDLLHGDANFARMYGLDAEKTANGLTMEGYQKYVVAEDLPYLRAQIRETFERGSDFLVEYRLALPGDPLRWVECKGRLIDGRDGKPSRFSGSAVDITKRKLAEVETRRLAAVVEQSSDFIGVADLDGSVAWVNESGRQLVGLADPESVKQTVIEDYFDPEQWPEIVAEVFPSVQRQGRWRGELRFRHFQSGELIPVIYDVIALRDSAGAVTAYATVTRDIREQKAADARQRILNEELSHRMKNTLAMVQAIATQSLRNVAEKDAVEAFKRRLHAIASAHNVLLQQNWSAAKIGSVAEAVLGTFEMMDRFDLSGEEIDLGPRATLSLSLLMHELATNALKYGALSVEDGRVSVTWDVVSGDEEDELILRWTEGGGPLPLKPERRGFGSRLIGMGLTGTGGTELHYPATGLDAVFTAPLSQLQQL